MNESNKPDKSLAQLRRIRGQLDGIIKMYESDRSCIDIVRQIVAARNSLSGVARSVLFDEATTCSRERRVEDLDKILKEMFKY